MIETIRINSLAILTTTKTTTTMDPENLEFVSDDPFSLRRWEYLKCEKNYKNAQVIGKLTFEIFGRSKFPDTCIEPCYRVCKLRNCKTLQCFNYYD